MALTSAEITQAVESVEAVGDWAKGDVNNVTQMPGGPFVPSPAKVANDAAVALAAASVAVIADGEANLIDETAAAIAAIAQFKAAIPWTALTSVTDTLQTYSEAGVIYAPQASLVPFTTGATFTASNWYVLQGFVRGNVGTVTNINRATVALMTADVNAIAGEYYSVEDYATGNNSGTLFFKAVAGAAPSPDGGKQIDHDTLSLHFVQNFPGWISVKAYGAKGNGAANDTVPIQNCLDFLESASDLAGEGGMAYFPGSIYMVSTLTWPQQVSAFGDGDFTSVIRSNTGATDTLVLFQGISRLGINNMMFDGNDNCGSCWELSATTTTGSMTFERISFLGALVDTIDVPDELGVDDFAHVTFIDCFLRSDPSGTPLNSQFSMKAANGFHITFINGILSTRNNPSAFNVSMSQGRISFFNTFFAGAATGDVDSTGGSLSVRDGRSESEGFFLRSQAVDTGGLTQLPHMIIGFEYSNTGVGGNFLDLQGTRTTSIDKCTSNRDISVNTGAVLEYGTFVGAEVLLVGGPNGIAKSLGNGPVTAQIDNAAPNPALEHFLKMENISSGRVDYAFAPGATANSIVLRNLSNGFDHMHYGNGSNAGNLGLNGEDYGGGEGVFFIANGTIVPTATPSGGGYMFVEGGALKWKGSGGTLTTIGPA